MIEEKYEPKCKCKHWLFEHVNFIREPNWDDDEGLIGCWITEHKEEKHPCSKHFGFPRKYCMCEDFKLDSLHYLEWKYSKLENKNER